MELTPADKQTLLSLARATLQHHLQSGTLPALRELERSFSAVLCQPGAAFVTLTTADGDLRGCIGDVVASTPLHESVTENTIRAATRDPRFPRVMPAELPELQIEISVLTPPQPVASHHEIELGKHGIILSKAGRRALFLPQVAPTQGWDLPETLTHLARKAGLPGDAWKSETQLQVFEAIVFGEGPQHELHLGNSYA